jgi:hypothetical protein
MTMPWRTPLAILLALASLAPAASAAVPSPGPPLTITRAGGAITVDGNLDDAGWQGIPGVTQWYETRVGDSVEPQVKNVGYLAYDDKYLYAAFRFEDPNPKLIRAPLGDRDQISGTTDYGGILVDSRNDGKTAQMFLANANGLMYDAISSDVTGEDSSPDYYWDTAGKVTESGWTLEIRVPFSSLRYSQGTNPTWGILLYRNYPREQHYQFFSSKLPRDVNCFICNSSKLTGFETLPQGAHFTVAPYATTSHTAVPRSGLGSPLQFAAPKNTSGADIKWSPLAGLAIDGTVKPDFSQVEADAGQIVANERFALFVPEKRTFFLEGVDLFATPQQAVYTRTINAPESGVRATGRAGNTAFTALYARDAGGGSVILPGPLGSDLAFQDFWSHAAIARARTDFGPSFVSALVTLREIDADGARTPGGAYNRVFGPDFQWRPRPSDTFTGQALWSESRTPDRPDLNPDGSGTPWEWNGQKLRDRALITNWSHNTRKVDLYVQGLDVGPDFRADNGFISQAGYREYYGQAGYTFRPQKKFFSRFRLFAQSFLDEQQDGTTLQRNAQLGFGADGRWASFWRLELNRDEFRVGNRMLTRFRPRIEIDASPSRQYSNFVFITYLGDEIDFANERKGSGVQLTLAGTWRPDIHTTVSVTADRRWLDVDPGTGAKERLFTVQRERVRGTYMFNSKCFVRLIAEYLETMRDPSLYTFPVNRQSSDLTLQGLLAYKLNWQTVLYAGYGDQEQFLNPSAELEKKVRQMFAKISYAWQL